MDFSCRPYDDNDIEGIFKLIDSHYGADYAPRRKEHFRYITQNNPYLAGRSPYHVIEADGELIGYVGRMPTYFIINDKEQEGFYSHDTLIRSDYRGKGVGPHLVRSQAESCNAIIVALWFNAANHRAYQKAGWTDIKGLTPFTRRLSFENSLAERIRSRAVVKTLSFLLDRLIVIQDLFNAKKRDAFSFEYLDRFDEKFDDSIGKISRNFKIIMSRKSALLNWKYSDRRRQGYFKFIMKNQDDFIGYMILKVTGRSGFKFGTIIDFLTTAHDPDAFGAMLKEAVRFFRSKGVCSITILTTEPFFLEVLHKHGFKPCKQSMDFMIARWENIYPEAFILDIRNWYITFGDADFAMWTKEV